MIDNLPDAAAPTAAATAHSQQYVAFSVAGETFAVSMGPVQEIIRVPEVARMPLAPPVLDGLANLRGRVLPIVSLRRVFGIEERANDDATRALVINLGQPLGFVVDRVASVISAEPGDIEPADRIRSIVKADFLTGVIKRMGADGQQQIMLTLDFERLLEGQFTRQAQSRAAGSDPSRHAGSEGVRTRDDAAGDDPTADELRLVSFSVEDQEYAIDISAVQEIVQVPDRIVALPNTAHHVLGVISLRRRLLPLLSLRSLFGLPTVGLNEHHRIVVVALPGGAQVGLVTDAVKEVLSVPRSKSDPIPAVLQQGGQMQEFASICRLDNGKRLVSIIDSAALLGLPAVQEAASAAVDDISLEDNAEGFAADADDFLEGDSMSTTYGARAARPQPGDEDAQVVIFRLGAEEFGVPIMCVQEIVRVPEVLTRVPKTPPFVQGVINLRGTVLPVVDQRHRLGMPAIERNDRQRIMVYTLNGLRTGFIVDSVAEVLRIPNSQIEAAPDLSDEQGRLITQVAKLDGDKRLVMLIEPSQLLGSREMDAVQELQGDDHGPTAGVELRRAA